MFQEQSSPLDYYIKIGSETGSLVIEWGEGKIQVCEFSKKYKYSTEYRVWLSVSFRPSINRTGHKSGWSSL